MRVVRTLLGIFLITFSVLSFLAGGGIVAALGHEGPNGAYGASVSGLDTTGYAIVVPDVGTLLRKQAPFARSSGGTLRVAASIGGAPAFVGLAPFSAVSTYLGPVPYGRVDTIHVGLHGLPVAVSTVAGPAARATAIPGGAPDRQRFWLARGTGGALAWSPGSGPAAAPGTALVIMRTDGAAGVHATATAELRPAGLVGTAATLLGAGTALALVAIALLLWPSARREIVYVVEPAQVPEIAARLGVPAGPAFAGAADRAAPEATDGPPAGDATGAAEPEAPAFVPEPREPEPTAETVEPTPAPARGTAYGIAPAPPGATLDPADLVAIFADPRTRPTSLTAVLLLPPLAPVGSRNTYRSAGAPPTVNPSFRWSATVPAEDQG